MTYQPPQVIQSSRAVHAIQGEMGKPFLLFLDFRPIRPLSMTVGAYETDE